MSPQRGLAIQLDKKWGYCITYNWSFRNMYQVGKVSCRLAVQPLDYAPGGTSSVASRTAGPCWARVQRRLNAHPKASNFTSTKYIEDCLSMETRPFQLWDFGQQARLDIWLEIVVEILCGRRFWSPEADGSYANRFRQSAPISSDAWGFEASQLCRV